MNNTCSKTLSSHHIWVLWQPELKGYAQEEKDNATVYKRCIACGLVDDIHDK